MKTIKNVMAALMLAAMMASLAVSCGKDNDPREQNGTIEKTDTSSGELVLRRILAFRERLRLHESNPDLRDTELMSVHDAVWNLEALFNYTYARPDFNGLGTVTFDTVLCLPANGNDSVGMADLSVFYQAMLGAVRQEYLGSGFDSRQLVLVDIEDMGRARGGVAVGMRTVLGGRSNDQPEPPDPPQPEPWPFGADTLWYYGEDHSNSYNNPMGVDAADILSHVLNDRIVAKAPEGWYYIYTDLRHKETNDPTDHPFSYTPLQGHGSYCEFLAEQPSPTDYWLDSAQMNFHFFGERRLILSQPPFGPDTALVNHVICQITVNDYSKMGGAGQTLEIGHLTTVYYGRCELMAGSNEGNENPWW